MKNGGGTVTQVSQRFAYQSYFDNALLHNALADQGVGEPIIVSTKKVSQTPGYVVGLHPSSESPIAIRFSGGDASDSQFVITPGQTLAPGFFETFEYGLPFGWLGGGNALIYVGHRPDVRFDFPSVKRSVPFHRARMVVDAAFPGTLRRNWPDAFPWPNAFAGAGLRPQGAGRVVSIRPAAAMFRLRVALAMPLTLNLIFRAVDVLDTNSAGVVSDTQLSTYDLSFPAVPVGSNAYPVAWLPEEIAALVGAGASLNIVDPSGEVDGEFVDVVRYGHMD